MIAAADLTLLEPQVEIAQPVRNLASSDCHMNLDLEALWSEFSDAPTLPPCLATGVVISTQKPTAHHSNQLPEIEYIFYSIAGSDHGFYWFGPDPLAPQTSGNDIFLHISAFPFLGKVLWVEFRLCQVGQITGEVVGWNVFYLPRKESFLGNLARIRRRILQHVSSYHCDTAAGPCKFRLSIYARCETSPESFIRRKAFCAGPCEGGSFDPNFFV